MPYIGRDLNRGNYLKLDDISSSFNSSTTTFNLTVGGSAFTPGSAFSILVSVGGVIQEPESAYQVNNSEITFANPPTAQDSFFCIALGVSLGIGVPGNGTVNGAQIAKPFNYDGFFYLNDSSNRVGINSSVPTVALDVIGDIKLNGNLVNSSGSGGLQGNVYAASGISTFNDVLVNGNLTVEGDTTTLNTTLRNVELLRVSAGSTLPAGIITQTNSGDILRLYDSSTQVFTVADGGNVGIGTEDPNFPLEIYSNNTSTNNQLRIEQDGTGDAVMGFALTGTRAYSLGIDNDDSDKFKISTATNLHTNTLLTIDGGSGGKVGIGTSLPDTPLHIYANDSQLLTVERAANTNSSIRFRNTIASMYAGLMTNAAGFAIDSDDNLGVSPMFMVKQSNGNVGIGTGIPAERLSVEDSSPAVLINATNASGESKLQFGRTGNTNVGEIKYEHSNNAFTFRTNDTADRLRITSDGAIGIGNLATSQNSVTQTSKTKLYVDSTKFTKIARLAAGNISSAGWFTVAKIAATNGNYFKCYASIGGDMVSDMCVIELTGSYNTSGALQNTYAEPIFKAHRTGLHSTDRITRARFVEDSSNITYLQIYIAGGVNSNTWGKSVLEYQIGAYSQNTADSGSAAMFEAGGSVTNIRTLEIDDNAICVNAGSHKFYSGGDATERLFIDSSGRHLIGDPTSRFYAAKLQVQGTSDSNYILMHNTTAGDGNGARYSKFIYSGTQSGGETSDLAHINAAHDGSADDQKGRLEFRVNTGAQNHSPVEALRIDSNGNLGMSCVPSSSGGAGTLYGTVDHFLAIGDSDTGIAQDGDGQLELWANNQEIVNFNVYNTVFTKSIGIGVTPAGSKFNSTHSPNVLAIGDSDTGIAQMGDGVLGLFTNNEERLRITTQGRVGINTDNPNSQLDVYKEGTGTVVDVIMARTSGGGGFAVQCSDVAAANPEWALRTYYQEDLVLSPGGHANTHEKIRIKATTGYVGIGTDNPGARLEAYGDDAGIIVHYTGESRGGIAAFENQRMAYVSTHVNDDLVFGYTNQPPSGANFVERFRIDNGNGNVGVGSTIPDARLDVFKDYDGLGAGHPAARIYGIDASIAETGIRFVEKGSGDIHQDTNAFLMRGISNGVDKFVFRANGNIGVGNTAPDTLLHFTHASAGTDVIKIEGKPLAASSTEISKIIFQVTQSNGQSARLAEIVSHGESNWGGQLSLNVKSSDANPNNNTEEALRIRSSDSAATNMKMVVDAYLQMGGYNNTNESFANLAVLFSARDMAGSSLVSDQTDTISGYARRRETGDGNGTFFFGPYGAFPCGDYTALIRMKISDRSGSSVVGYIDIIGTGIETQGRNISPITSTRRIDVQTNDFTESDKYQYFALDFSKSSSAAHIETRFLNYSSSTADIYLDHVLILPRISHGFEGGTGVFDY